MNKKMELVVFRADLATLAALEKLQKFLGNTPGTKSVAIRKAIIDGAKRLRSTK